MKFEEYYGEGKEVDYLLQAELQLKWHLAPLERYTLVFPRGVTRLQMDEMRLGRRPLHLTASSFAICSPMVDLNISAVSFYGRVAVLRPSAIRWAEHVKENQLSESLIGRLGGEWIRSFRLTKWLDELVDRYDFESRINSRTPAQCPFFVEKQIVNEVIRILCPEDVPTTGELVGFEKDNELARVLTWIDEHIFQDINVESIALQLKASASQANRIFQQKLGKTPIAYINDLRLEYAARFLERGEFTPSDLATMCGFSELSAFSRAFKRKFKVAPSDYGFITDRANEES